MSAAIPGLFMDLYQLTMVEAYLRDDLTDEASFELSIRRLPAQRNFLLLAGLAEAVDYLESLRFERSELDHLASLGLFSDALLSYLADFRFSGSLDAVPEGTPVFAGTPLLTLTAPLPQAQLVETVLLNLISSGTMLASKAARVMGAARGRSLVDFGARRTHGIDAGFMAARSLYLAGFDATSNVEAGRRYGIPVSGTMAHSFIQAHPSELDAFRAYARAYPQGTLLVDTYETAGGIANLIALRDELERDELGQEFQIRSVRIDSGDLAAEAFASRAQLDAAGLESVQIVASGGLDEYGIDALLGAAAPIDGFGVGTNVGTSADAPNLESVYKLVEFAGSGRSKRSSGKETLPHRKQVFRRFREGHAIGDTVALREETLAGTALLEPVMQGGRAAGSMDLSLDAARTRAAAGLAALPDNLRSLDPSDPYPVTLSEALQEGTAAPPPQGGRASD
ncbi:MAG: nicotinate phosphoribosyltransferase [Chloroflexi bacterium]|nr:nicotinate phosphoribosyltransferase [Chloroflexota bacterium]